MTEEGKKLADLIKKAIANHELTTSEYNAILNMANEDRIIDAHEKVLLAELQEMVSNGTVKRVPDN